MFRRSLLALAAVAGLGFTALPVTPAAAQGFSITIGQGYGHGYHHRPHYVERHWGHRPYKRWGYGHPGRGWGPPRHYGYHPRWDAPRPVYRGYDRPWRPHPGWGW